jgi:hypothetical protein
MLTHGRAEAGDSHPIINEWVGAWAVLGPEQGQSEIKY